MKHVLILISVLALGVSARAQKVEQPADSISHQLQEVVVTSKHPVTRLEGSKLVSIISGSNLANLGTALDVLGQLPMIKVEGNGLSIIGKSNVEIYIDGHPMRDSQELVQLLSTNLRKVELLMAPGTAYASTTGAVLKIYTKHNFIKGLSVTNQSEAKRTRRWSLMDYLSMSYRRGNWELFAGGMYNNSNSVITGTTVNTLTYKGVPTTIGSTQHNAFPTTTGIAKVGFNYNRGDESFGAYYRYNPERGDFLNRGTEWIDREAPVERDITRSIRSHGHLVATYYENKFSDKFLLHFDGDFHASNTGTSSLTSYKMAGHDDVRSTDRRESSLVAGKLYLNFPLWSGDFTVGTQDSYTHTTLDYRMLNAEVGSYIPSTLTEARQTSAALFASWSSVIGRFNLSAGARYEYVDYDFTVNGKRDDEMSRRHNLLTPDVSIGYTFNDEAQVNLSYKMTTVKPPYSRLTGALTYVGRHEIEGGNPALRDERMHDAQLFGMWRDFMVQTNLTRSIDAHAFVKQLHHANSVQLLMHPVNIDLTSLNLYLIWNKTLGHWTPDVTLGLYRQWLEIAGTSYNRPIVSYYFNNTLSLPRGWTLTANVTGSSKGDMGTNCFSGSWFTMDASVGRSFLNKSLTVKLSATDLFNTECNDWTMNTMGIMVDKRQRYDRRGIALNVIYNFQPRKSKYKGEAASDSELNRL